MPQDVNNWPLKPLTDAEAADRSWLAADRLLAGLTSVVVISIHHQRPAVDRTSVGGRYTFQKFPDEPN